MIVKPVAWFAGFAFTVCIIFPAIPTAAQNTSPVSAITVPTGTRISLDVVGPVWSHTAKAGDALYTRVDFPVTTGNAIAIPPGTYAQATIQSLTRPSRFKARAQMQVLFTTLIFANGYAVSLPTLASDAAPPATNANQAPDPPTPTLAELSINVSSSNDLLLDNGTQFEISLAAPLSLDANQIAAAIPLSGAVDLGKLRSATQCRPTQGTPGTPGTSDTVIPGTPGTPDITIPGGPGMPDTTIPGTPATPPTVIPGTPGTPGFAGRSCPPPPIVISSVPISASALPAQNASSAIIH